MTAEEEQTKLAQNKRPHSEVEADEDGACYSPSLPTATNN
jgi:hypothetical protein